MGFIKKIFLLLSLIAFMYGCAAKQPQIKTDYTAGAPEKAYYHTDIYFAGMQGDIKQNFKYSKKIIDESFTPQSVSGKCNSVERCLMHIALDSKTKYINFEKNDDGFFAKADEKGDKTIVVAPVIDREYVSVLPLGDSYKIIAELDGQILAMDLNPEHPTIISSTPIQTQYIHNTKHKPTEEDKIELFKRLLWQYSENGITKEGLFLQEFEKKLPDIRIKSDSKMLRVQLKTVNTEEMKRKSRERLENSGEDEDAYKFRVANIFAGEISNQNAIPILPYVGKDGEKYNLTGALEKDNLELNIPEPDYAVNLNLIGYNVKESEAKGIHKTVTYISLVDVDVCEIENKKCDKYVYNGSFRGYVGSGQILKEREITDSIAWASLADATKVLAKQFAIHVYNPSGEWEGAEYKQNKNNPVSKSEIKNKFKVLQGIFDKCR